MAYHMPHNYKLYIYNVLLDKSLLYYDILEELGPIC